ncbi:MAG: flavodoxin family protein [Candidatus Alcyoniella australis]|nr:flavodoxin family protein [Candidatus Alcyoniella australis]
MNRLKIVALCGSPIKNGNTCHFIQRALEPLPSSEVDCEIIELAKLRIDDCNHCNWCLKNKDEGRICKIDDQAEPILHTIKSADVLVVASPAYYGRMSGRLACLLDRTRPFIFSPAHRGCMADKPGVALAVGWGRNAGLETTLQSIVWSFLVLEMLPVSHHNSGALLGAAGISNPLLVNAAPDDKHAVDSDVVGILAAQGVVKRAIDLAGRING